MTAPGMLMMLQGLIQIIQSSFHSDPSLESGTRLKKGLQLWKAKWDAAILLMSTSQLEMCGFFKDAGPEFWHLACYLLTTRDDTARSEAQENSCSIPGWINIFRELVRSARSLK